MNIFWFLPNLQIMIDRGAVTPRTIPVASRIPPKKRMFIQTSTYGDIPFRRY